jgi:hypothetical protein
MMFEEIPHVPFIRNHVIFNFIRPNGREDYVLHVMVKESPLERINGEP